MQGDAMPTRTGEAAGPLTGASGDARAAAVATMFLWLIPAVALLLALLRS